MRRIEAGALLASAWLTLGCGSGEAVSAEDGADTTTASGKSGEESTGGASSGGDADGTESMAADESGGTGDPDDTGDTGTGDGETSDPPEEEVELLVYRANAAGWMQFFRVRSDGVDLEGPILAHDDEEAHWNTATPLTGHRVAYSLSNPGASELRLATLDDPLPAETVGIDDAPEGPGTEGWPLEIPGVDALLYATQDRLYRVDLDGLDAQPPELLAPIRAGSSVLNRRIGLDPAGRYAVVQQPEHEPFETSLARVSLAGDDAGAVEGLTPATSGTTVSQPELLPSGDGAFFALTEDGVPRLMFVALGDGPGEPVAMTDALPPPDAIDWTFPSEPAARPHDDARGMVLWIGERFDHELRYYGLDADDTPRPPVDLHDPAAGDATRNGVWAPDGRTFRFELAHGATHSLWVAQFGDGHEPALSQLAEYEPSPADNFTGRWAPDGQHLYVQRRSPERDGFEVLRYEMLDDGPGAPQILAGVFENVTLWGLTPDSAMVLFSARDGEEIQLWGVDVSSRNPGRPMVLNAPLEPGYWAQFPVSSPGGQFIAYTVRNDIFGDHALMLLDLDAPGEAIQVADPFTGVQFVPPR